MFSKKQRFWSVPSYRGLTIRRLALCVGLVVFVAWSNTWAQSPDPDADVNSAPPKPARITLANPGPQSVTIRDRSGKSVKLAPKTAAKISTSQRPYAVTYWSGNTHTGWKTKSISKSGRYEFRFSKGTFTLASAHIVLANLGASPATIKGADGKTQIVIPPNKAMRISAMKYPYTVTYWSGQKKFGWKTMRITKPGQYACQLQNGQFSMSPWNVGTGRHGGGSQVAGRSGHRSSSGGGNRATGSGSQVAGRSGHSSSSGGGNRIAGGGSKNKAGQKSIAGGGGSKTNSGVTPSTKAPASLPIRDKLLADANAAKKGHEDAVAIADKAATVLKDEQSKLETLEAEVQERHKAASVLNQTLSDAQKSTDLAGQEAQRARDDAKRAEFLSDQANKGAARTKKLAEETQTNADKAKAEFDAAQLAHQPIETAYDAATAELHAAEAAAAAARGTPEAANASANYMAKQTAYLVVEDKFFKSRDALSKAEGNSRLWAVAVEETGNEAFSEKTKADDLILIAAKAIDSAASKHDDFNRKQFALNHMLKTKDDFDQETISKVKQHAGLSDQRDGLRNLLNQANEAVKQALSKRSTECDKLIAYLVSDTK